MFEKIDNNGSGNITMDEYALYVLNEINAEAIANFISEIIKNPR